MKSKKKATPAPSPEKKATPKKQKAEKKEAPPKEDNSSLKAGDTIEFDVDGQGSLF